MITSSGEIVPRKGKFILVNTACWVPLSLISSVASWKRLEQTDCLLGKSLVYRLEGGMRKWL